MSNRRKFGKNNKSKSAESAGVTPINGNLSAGAESASARNTSGSGSAATSSTAGGGQYAPITRAEVQKTSEEFKARTVYDRARWKNGMRVFGVVLMVLLNISLVGSDIERAQKMARFALGPELITFGCLILMDITILLPLIFEVDTVELYQDTLVMKLLFWKTKLKWEQIQYFKMPPMLKFAIIKSPKCFYLINRRDIRNFPLLAESIMKHESQFTPKIKA